MWSAKDCRAVVFDLDDTLYPEIEYVKSGFRAAAGWAGAHFQISAETAFQEFMEIFDGGNRGNIFDRWLSQHYPNAEGVVSHLVQTYRDHLPSIRPFPEVPELLAALKTRYRLALLTDGHAAVQQRKLSVLGIGPLFEVLIFSDEWGRDAWKPNSRVFGIALEKLRLDGSEAIYIADNPAKDFLGAKTMKMGTIRMRHPSGLYSMLDPPDPSYAADCQITNHIELFPLLLG